jgi:ADP-heptose:LPS heptosyltransferase
MTIDTIRFIDRKLIKIFRDFLILGLGKPRAVPRSPIAGDRLLIMKFWGLGNIIQAGPALKMIRESFPDCHITFLTLTQNQGLYDNNGLYDESLTLPLKDMLPFAWEVAKLISRFRKQRYDWVIDLDPLTYFSESMAYLSGAPCRIGFVRSDGERSLYTHPQTFNEDDHISDVFQSVALLIGASHGDSQLIPIKVSNEDSEFIGQFFQENQVSDGDFVVGINVNASDVAKERRWPQDRFAELADRIVASSSVKVVLLGSAAEREYVQAVVDQMSNVPIVAAGKTSLRQMIALLGKCNLFISNDSGPVHMAGAQSTPTVAIFGPESPERYGPRGKHQQVIYKGLPCSPCISFRNAKKVHCEHPAPPCIYDITVDELWAMVKPLLPPKSSEKKASSYSS